MPIGTSNGDIYENDFDFAFAQFDKSKALPSESSQQEEGQPSSGEQTHTYEPRQVSPDDLSLTAGATWGETSHLMDMMDMSARIQRDRFGGTIIPPITTTAEKGKFKPTSSLAPELLDEGGSDSIAARPVDPSVDSFIDRYGVWNIHDKIIKNDEDYRIDNEMTRDGKIKLIKPGSKKWHGGVISDVSPDPIRPGQQFAELDNMTPELMKIRLNQLLYDRSLSKKSGIDTEGPLYAASNAKIRQFRDAIKAGPK